MLWVLIAFSGPAFGFTASFHDKPACEVAAAKFVQEMRDTHVGSPRAFCVPNKST